MKMVRKPFVAMARVVSGTASVTEDVRGSACGMACGAMGALGVVLAAQLAWSPEEYVAWLIAIGLLIALPLGAWSGVRNAGGLLAAPAAPEGIVVRSRPRGVLAGCAAVLAVAAGLTAGVLLGKLGWPDHQTTGEMIAAALLPALPALGVIGARELVVWRTAIEVERRWPVHLVRHRPPGWLTSATVYAVHPDPPTMAATAPNALAGQR